MARWSATNSAGFESPAALAVDIVVLSIRGDRLHLLVTDRPRRDPVLPGAFVLPTETAGAAVLRMTQEKAGLRRIYFEQLEAFTAPDRDPRGWIPTVAHLALAPGDTEPIGADASWIPVEPRPHLGFDHSHIVQLALDRLVSKLWRSNIASGLLPEDFTMTQAREAYSAITGILYDPSTFARDLRATGLVVPTGRRLHQVTGRPAALYHFASVEFEWGQRHRKHAPSSR